MTPEQRLNARLRDKLWGDTQRIEGTPGCPDINACYNCREVWIESKIVRKGKVTFEPGQIPWMKRRRKQGGWVFVAAYDAPILYIISGDYVEILRDHGVKSPFFQSGTKTFRYDMPIPWDEVNSVIYGLNLIKT